MTTKISVLLVEDNPAQAELAKRALSEVTGASFDVHHVTRLTDGISRAALGGIEVVLLDLNLPDSRGLSTVVHFLGQRFDVPVVVLTSHDDENIGIEAMKTGAQDYIIKDRVNAELLGRTIRYAVERARYQAERRAAQERELELERLREVDRLKGQFFDLASHELNTPLTPLKMQVELLQSMALGPLNERQRKAVELVFRSVDRLARLVEEMLDINRVQRGRLRLDKQAVDLDRVVNESVDLFREPLRQGGIELDVRTNGGLLLDGDPRRLSQVLINLLSNALRFTPPDGRVVVETESRDTQAVVHVQDTGIGFTEEQKERLFLPFSQVHPVENARNPGSGLGLYICKGIVEQHGGRMWCESRGPHLGSTFSFSIPLRPVVVKGRNGDAGKRPLGPVGVN